MKIEHPLTGAMVALITPMFADGTIDFDALANLVEFHIENGTKAIVSMGTTGDTIKNLLGNYSLMLVRLLNPP
jgi:4-hydroxy-tetrahydrodipicolinate synthase